MSSGTDQRMLARAMRGVPNGRWLRIGHVNGANLFFMCIEARALSLMLIISRGSGWHRFGIAVLASPFVLMCYGAAPYWWWPSSWMVWSGLVWYSGVIMFILNPVFWVLSWCGVVGFFLLSLEP